MRRCCSALQRQRRRRRRSLCAARGIGRTAARGRQRRATWARAEEVGVMLPHGPTQQTARLSSAAAHRPLPLQPRKSPRPQPRLRTSPSATHQRSRLLSLQPRPSLPNRSLRCCRRPYSVVLEELPDTWRTPRPTTLGLAAVTGPALLVTWRRRSAARQLSRIFKRVPWPWLAAFSGWSSSDRRPPAVSGGRTTL